MKGRKRKRIGGKVLLFLILHYFQLSFNSFPSIIKSHGTLKGIHSPLQSHSVLSFILYLPIFLLSYSL